MKKPSKKTKQFTAAAAVSALLVVLIIINRPAPQDTALVSRLASLIAKNSAPRFVDAQGFEVTLRDLSGIFYQSVVFSVPATDGRANDIYTAQARIFRGQLSIRKIRNLSNTPDADESVYCVGENKVAFANSVRGKFRSVSTVRLSGKNIKYFKFEKEAKEVRLYWLKSDSLSVSWKEGRAGKTAAVNALTGNVTPPGEGLVFSAEIKGGEHWFSKTVNFVRGITGPGFIAWLEEKFFDVKDRIDGLIYSLGKVKELTGGKIEETELVPVTPFIGDNALPGEGVWSVEGCPGGAEKGGPLMAKTFIRPDEKRPYAIVYLLYIDLDRAEVLPVAGTEHPKSTTGIKGPGVIPDDDDVRSRLLADFSGGFQAQHGGYGMMVDGDILIPAQTGIATACFYADGSMKIGAWNKDVFDSTSLVSYRQNLPPLVIDGKYNSDNTFWGYTPKVMKTSYTWRTGMGLTKDGKLIYAIGNSLVAETLAKALIAAGVKNGMQLDMNASNVICEIYSVEKDAGGSLKIDSRRFCKGLVLPAKRYLTPQTRDFFYVIRKK